MKTTLQQHRIPFFFGFLTDRSIALPPNAGIAATYKKHHASTVLG